MINPHPQKSQSYLKVILSNLYMTKRLAHQLVLKGNHSNSSSNRSIAIVIIETVIDYIKGLHCNITCIQSFNAMPMKEIANLW